MWRTLPAISVALLTAVCVSGCGGGGDDKASGAKPKPAAVPSGFVAETSRDWSFARPQDWTPIDTGKDEPGTRYVGFESAPGTQGVPSQVGMGVDTTPETKNLARAVEVARTINNTRYQRYDVSDEQPVTVAGGKATRFDATYRAYTDEPMDIRIVEILVQMDDGRQMSFLVRGPAPDFERLGLAKIVASFRPS